MLEGLYILGHKFSVWSVVDALHFFTNKRNGLNFS